MTRTTGNLHKTNIYIYMITSRSVLHRIRTVSNKVVEKIKKHNLDTFFFENLAFYEIMRKIIVEPDREQMIIWFLRIDC
jgi:hypothetical protein